MEDEIRKKQHFTVFSSSSSFKEKRKSSAVYDPHLTPRSASNLQDSVYSVDSTESNSNTSSSAKNGDSGFFGGFGADLRNVANCLTDNVGPVMTGVANMMQRTALKFANEIAQLEHDEDAASERVRGIKIKTATQFTTSVVTTTTDSYSKSCDCVDDDEEKNSLILPWEIRRNTSNDNGIPVYFTDTTLMENILGLSSRESTFLEPFAVNEKDPDVSGEYSTGQRRDQVSPRVFSSSFIMDNRRVNLIRRLMDIDKNLATMHSRFSGKSKVTEELFWRNYFYHCEEIRSERLGGFEITDPKPAEMIEAIANRSEMRHELEILVNSIAKNDDEESLVPAESGSDADDSSYVIPSSPNSVNTLATTRSVDDLVLIDNHHTTPLDSSRGVDEL